MTWIVDPAASFGERGGDVAPVSLGGKNNDVVQPATVPPILDAGGFILGLDRFDLNAEVAPFVVSDH